MKSIDMLSYHRVQAKINLDDAREYRKHRNLREEVFIALRWAAEHRKAIRALKCAARIRATFEKGA